MNIGIFGALGVVFVTLKLVGVIDWAWWLVLLPFYFGLAFWALVFIFACFYYAIADAARKARRP